MYTSETLAQFGITDESVVLFDQAHPDDETVAYGALMLELNREGVETHLSHVTLGEESTEGDPALVKSGYRLNELLAFGKAVGVPIERMHQFHLKDGDLNRVPQRLAHMYKLARLIGSTGATHLFVPGIQHYEVEPHSDHWSVWRTGRAVGRMFNAAGKPLAVWSNAEANQMPVAAVLVDPSVKLDLLRFHDTQFNLDPSDDDQADFFGQPVASDTARRLAQYAPFFTNEQYVPLVGRPQPVERRLAATVLAAIR